MICSTLTSAGLKGRVATETNQSNGVFIDGCRVKCVVTVTEMRM